MRRINTLSRGKWHLRSFGRSGAILVAATLLIGITGCDRIKAKESVQAEFSAVNRICELATLRCYYHDVAEYEEQPEDRLLHNIFQYGYKKFWIEYDGIIEVGVDVSKVKVNEPDKNGVVKIYVPKAEILNIQADLESMGDWISETGMFTKITIAEKSEAFSKAQETMRINAQKDNNILLQAQENAKELLRQYVINVGKDLGEEYTVEWISDEANG